MENYKLKEIIWEVIVRCNKNCIFCGSKEILNTYENDDYVLETAKKILEYPPEELVLSGGEPSLLPNEILENIVDMFQNKLKLKMLTNGSLYDKMFLEPTLEEKLKSITIGLSINTLEDIKSLKNPKYKDNITVITNFGIHNIWNFEQIEDFIKVNDFKLWQIQLTQGEYMLLPAGIEYLLNKIKKTKIHYVLADNLQYNHTCTAGKSTCGILFNGDVVSCLSQRSYLKHYELEIHGNILKTSLKDIWENEFKDIRSITCKNDICNKNCRSFIKYPNTWNYLFSKQDETFGLPPHYERTFPIYEIPSPAYSPTVVMYGVVSPYSTEKNPIPPFTTADTD